MRLNWNSTIPKGALRRFRQDSEALVGTSWSLSENLRVYRVCAIRDNLATVCNVVDSTLSLIATAELLGALSKLAYEGRNISWAQPTSLVATNFLVDETTLLCRVEAWGLYQPLVAYSDSMSVVIPPGGNLLNDTLDFTMRQTLIRGVVRQLTEAEIGMGMLGTALAQWDMLRRTEPIQAPAPMPMPEPLELEPVIEGPGPDPGPSMAEYLFEGD